MIAFIWIPALHIGFLSGYWVHSHHEWREPIQCNSAEGVCR